MNERIRRIAKEQSAIECACLPEDFDRTDNVIVRSEQRAGARKYLKLPFACQLVSYGNNIVASVQDGKIEEAVRKYLAEVSIEQCFETPALHRLDEALAPCGVRSHFMAEYFLPRKEHSEVLPCPFPAKVLLPAQFGHLYLPEWGNALCAQRPENDVLCVAAYDGDKLIGLAGASADCDTMWQIGIDVLPEYRRMGIASALTSRLAREVFDCGKIPFYCAAWCNIKSVGNAIKSGFYPAWAELTCLATEKL